MNGSSGLPSLMSRMPPYSATAATIAIKHSITSIRAPVKWSASSFRKTTPTPLRAEPSRRMKLPSLSRPLEIAGIDRFETGGFHRQKLEPAAGSDDLRRRLGPNIAIRQQPDASAAEFLNTADARDQRQPLRKTRALNLDIDGVAAAKHLAAELGDGAHQRDPTRLEQRD